MFLWAIFGVGSEQNPDGKIQKVVIRDFPQTKVDSEINFPFLLNEHSDHQFFLENSSQLGVFWPRRRLQADHETVRKSAIFSQPSNQKQLK